MTTEEITEGNRLIAEFLGWYIDVSISEKYPTQEWHYTKQKGTTCWDGGRCVHLDREDFEQRRKDVDKRLWEDLVNHSYSRCGKFHSSWDKLMPVVSTITSMEEWDEFDSVNHANTTLAQYLLMVNIQSVFRECVDFIKYYNSQNNG